MSSSSFYSDSGITTVEADAVEGSATSAAASAASAAASASASAAQAVLAGQKAVNAAASANTANNASVSTVASDLSGSDTIGTVAGSISNVNTVAGIASDVNTVAGSAYKADVETVANSAYKGKVETVAGTAYKEDIETVADTAYKAQVETVSDSTYKAKVESVAADLAGSNTIGAAVQSAANAAVSASNAATSASSASASLGSATTQAGNAQTHSNTASGFKDDAESAKNAAQAAQSVAQGHRTQTGQDVTATAASATSASNSSSSSAASEANAASSASAAATSASNAATSETNSEGSKNASALSASAAATSATNAAASATEIKSITAATGAAGSNASYDSGSGVLSVPRGDTGATGATGSVTLNSVSGNLSFGDSDKATFGAGDDLQIYHSGTHSYIKDAGTGNLNILASASINLLNGDSSDYMARFNDNGSNQFFYDGGQKLATTSTGIDVTGTATMDAAKVETSTTSTVTISENTGNGTAELRFVATDSFPKTKIVTDVSAASLTLETLGNDRLKIANNGDISFYDTSGNAKLVWDASAESLGIGTSSPAKTLSVAGNLQVDSGAANSDVSFVADDGYDVYLGFGTAADRYASHIRKDLGPTKQLTISAETTLALKTNSAERLRIDSSGRVGIGTSSPHFELSVHESSANADARIHLTNADTGTGTGDGFQIIMNGANAGRQVNLLNREASPMAFWTNNTERLRIDSSGNVGIGTSSPASKLDSQETYDTVTNILTNGTYAAKFGGDTGVGAAGRAQGIMISGRNGTARGAAILAENQNSGNAHDLLFATSSNAAVPAERMRIDSSGRVGIGTSSPSQELHVVSSGESDIRLQGSGSANHLDIFHNASDFGLWGTGTQVFKLATNNAERMRIDSSGRVGIGTDSPSSALEVAGSAVELSITDSRDGSFTTGDTVASLGFYSDDTSGGSGTTPTLARGAIDVVSENTFGSSHGMVFRTRGDITTAAAEAMRITHDGNVGIGTSSPNQLLSINSTIAGERGISIDQSGTERVKLLYSNNSGAFVIDNTTAGYTGFKNNGAERMRIDSSGRVGIGTSSPSRKLTIQGGAGDTLPVRVIGGSGTTTGGIEFQDAATTADYKVQIGSIGDNLYLRAGGAERMRIDSSGNLLVGKSATGTGTVGAELRANGFNAFVRDGGEVMNINRLSSDGTIVDFRKDSSTVGSIGTASTSTYIDGGSELSGLQFGGDGTSEGRVVPRRDGAIADGETTLGTSSYRFKDLYLSGTANAPVVSVSPYTGLFNAGTNKIGFQINGQQKAQIDSSGNLLVGKTGASVSTAGAELRADGQISSTRSGDTPVFINRLTNDGNIIDLRKDNTTVGSISVTGSATSYNTSSDQRLKENIADADDAGSKIDAIQVRKYDWKADGSHQDYGMIAQELQTVAPEAVSGDADSEEMMGVDYSKLVPMLIKEIQSLRNRVAQLEE